MKNVIKTVWNNLKFFIFFVIIVLFLVYIFRFDFSKRIDYQVNEMVTEHLADISRQSVTALNGELTRVKNEVAYTAEYLSQRPDIAEEEEQLLYQQLKEKCGFSNIRLVSKDGKLYSSDYQPLSGSIGGYIEAINRGESGMTDIFQSNIMEEKVLAFYAPIRRNGEFYGGIAGIMIVDQIKDIIANTGFNSNSYSYILKPDGSVVSQTSHVDSLYNGRDFLAFLRGNARNGDQVALNLRTNMNNKKSGVFFYQMKGENRIAYFEPANHKDWYVITAVSTKVANQYTSHINQTALYLIFKLILAFVVIAILIIYWSKKTREMILASKEALELEKKKLELALHYSTNAILDYKVKEDCLTFITPPVIKEVFFTSTFKNVKLNAKNQTLIALESVPDVLNALSYAIKGETPNPLEFAGGSAFDDEIWFKLTLSPIQDGKGHVIEVIATMEDITEERNIRRRFAQEEQYREALLSETLAMWSVDLIKQEVTAYNLTGRVMLAEGKTLPYSSVLRLLKRIPPEDQTRIAEMVQIGNMLSAYYVGTKELKDLFRICYPSETNCKWVSCTISLLTEPTSGNPIAFAYVRDVDEETRREMELSYSSERDPLTGLYNRRNIADKINHLLKEEGTLSCLMMMDLDGFKEVNDNYGHQTGDLVLKKVAQILLQSFRSDDLVARLGGDEFLIFLTNLPNQEKACSRAEYVRQQVLKMGQEDALYHLSMSIGLSFAPADGNDFVKLYKCADEALYSAKHEGKNRIKLYKKN